MPPRKKYVLKSNLAEKKADDDDTNIYSQDIPIEKAVQKPVKEPKLLKFIPRDEFIKSRAITESISTLKKQETKIMQQIEQVKQYLSIVNMKKYAQQIKGFNMRSDRQPSQYQKKRPAVRVNQERDYGFAEKYVRDQMLIDAKEMGLETELKSLKKWFIESYCQGKERKDLKTTIKACKTYPMLYMQFEENGETKHMILREITALSKKIREHPDIISTCLARLYSKVDHKYLQLRVFGVERAKELKLRLFVSGNQGREACSNETMFYYTIVRKKRAINFLILDRGLRAIIEFSTAFIMQCQNSYPQEFELWKKFQKESFSEGQRQPEDKIEQNFFNNEEIDSDEDVRIKVKEPTMRTVKGRLETILNKDIEYLQNLIEEKNEQFNKIVGLDRQDSKLNRLGDEIEELVINRDNFVQAKDEVKERLRSLKGKDQNEIYKLCLKKMIIAQKQLDSKLPIVAKKREIFERLKKSNLLIIEGETGSGKSTQLPQILSEYYKLFDNVDSLPVLVTQPRKLSTRSLAQRVAYQIEQTVGGFVDYMASADRTINQKAKIIFKFDRLLLDEITEDQILSRYSCLVIDQAHQRTISIDVILGLIKKLLSKRKDFKIIVTSASMDIGLFQKYFNTKALKVSGRLFPVEIIYKDYPEISETVGKIQRLLKEEIFVSKNQIKAQYKGHVLVFCSSVQEITKLINIFTNMLNPNVFKVFALHGKISPENQRLVFASIKQHKIIFASRIAQTAITIDGIKVVVDPGFDFETVYDQKCKISSMKREMISQSSAKQRAGRAGRTAAGICFRLYNQREYNSRRPNKVPEIENSGLQTVVLRLKSLKIEDVINFSYISRPDVKGLQKSLQILKMLGGLDSSQNITQIGLLLVRIPIDPFLSRAIVQSLIFEQIFSNDDFVENYLLRNDKAVDDNIRKFPLQQINQFDNNPPSTTVIEILCMVIHSSMLFYIPQECRQIAEKLKFQQFANQDGDFFFLRNIYKRYKQLYNSRSKDKRKWLNAYFLSEKTLKQVNELENEIQKIVRNFICNKSVLKNQFQNAKARLRYCKSYEQAILACLTTSFCANLCRYSGNPNIGYTLISHRKPIQIYGTSNLSLQGITPTWIVCYDLCTNKQGRLFCKVAHKIDFQFMENTIDNYVWKQFKIKQAQKVNPYYQKLIFDLPTRVIQQVKFDSYKRDYPQFEFLQVCGITIVEEINQIRFYSIIQQEQQNEETIIEKKIHTYIAGLQADNLQPYYHNYVGHIFVNLSDGFTIDSIQFSKSEILIEIYKIPELIKAQFVQQCNYFGRVEEQQIKIKLFITDYSIREQFYSFLMCVKKQNPQAGINYKQSLVDMRRKLPRVKIMLRFFASDLSKPPQKTIFICYETYFDGKNEAEENLSYIKEGISKIQQLNGRMNDQGFEYRPPRRNNEQIPNPLSQLKDRMSLSRKKNGINIFHSPLDEFQIFEALHDMNKKSYFDFRFKMPKFIKCFRDYDLTESKKTDKQWMEQITELMSSIGCPKNNYSINVRGYYKPDRARNERGRFKPEDYQKDIRVQMYAEITTFDLSALIKLKNKYNGKVKILGTEKLHVRASYDMIVAIVNQHVFFALKEEFQYKLFGYKEDYPLMTFDLVNFRSKNKVMMKIICHAPNRDQLILPQREIGNLFTPRFIRLQPSQFEFLNRKGGIGDQILYQIEQSYNFNINFGFQKVNHSLKLYCEDKHDLFVQVQKKLKNLLKQYQYFSESISYKGKNLHLVLRILKTQQQKIAAMGSNNKKTFLQYEISYKFRQINLVADLATLNEMKNRIQQLVNANQGECSICTDIMRSPYRLINCGHSFCWLCLTAHIRNFRNSPNEQLLKCPQGSCDKLININDVRAMLSIEQFNKTCDIRVAKYVQINKDKYITCTTCEQIFDRKEVEKDGEIDCELCGNYFCLKCNLSHRNYTCEEWKNKDSTEHLIKKLGIKQCPKCRTGIEKNGGCNHMQCKNCKAHICWNCFSYFGNSKDCYDHLANSCGGIFNAQPV